MAYTYLTVVNEILRTLGEETYTSGDFSTAVDVGAHVKDKVNTVIEDMYMRVEGEWPFSHGDFSQVLTAGTQQYALDATAAKVDWDSFYLDFDAALDTPNSRQLKMRTASWYRDNRKEIDKDITSADQRAKPIYLIRRQDDDYIVTPNPDAAYTLRYEGFIIPTELSTDTDVPDIPQQFKQAIIEGVLYHGYLFKDNFESAQLSQDRYEDTINSMRRQLIGISNYMRYID